MEIIADTFIQPVYLLLPAPNTHLCYLAPSSVYFGIGAFVAPTILHHAILVYTLYKAQKHLEAERTLGGGSVVKVLRNDSIFYVLVSHLSAIAEVAETDSRAGDLSCKLCQRHIRFPKQVASLSLDLVPPFDGTHADYSFVSSSVMLHLISH